ncbi:MAG: hypothetical protein ACR2GY_05355 [Phycisphaerales bacterium]
MSLLWVAERLPVHDEFTQSATVCNAHAAYLRAYENEQLLHTPRLDGLLDQHAAAHYAHIPTARAICKTWRGAVEALAMIERSFWSQLERSEGVNADIGSAPFVLIRLERECRLVDIKVLNKLPETQVDLRELLGRAEVSLEQHPDVREVVTDFYRRRLALLRKRADAAPRTLDDLSEYLAANHNVRDDNFEELTIGHIAEALNFTIPVAGRRMYAINVEIAQHVRTTLDRLEALLPDDARERLLATVQSAFYGDVYDRDDPVADTFHRLASEGYPVASSFERYLWERRRVEAAMVALIVEYRDQWLAGTGHPMIRRPMIEHEVAMRELVEKLEALESRWRQAIKFQFEASSVSEDKEF